MTTDESGNHLQGDRDDITRLLKNRQGEKTACAVVGSAMTTELLRKKTDGILWNLVLRRKVTDFIVTPSRGFSLYAAEEILNIKKEIIPVTLECVLPFEAQATRWSQGDRDRYFKISEKANRTVLISRRYSSYCREWTERYLLDRATVMLTTAEDLHGQRSFGQIARELGKTVLVIDCR